MSIELVFIAMLLIWSILMAYLIYLHVRQKRLRDEISRLSRLMELKERED